MISASLQQEMDEAFKHLRPDELALIEMRTQSLVIKICRLRENRTTRLDDIQKQVLKEASMLYLAGKKRVMKR